MKANPPPPLVSVSGSDPLRSDSEILTGLQANGHEARKIERGYSIINSKGEQVTPVRRTSAEAWALAARIEQDWLHWNTPVSYHVLDENTLGYIHPAQPNDFQPLGRNVNGHHWINGSVFVLPGQSKLRPANSQDFNTFRVMPPTDFLCPSLTTNTKEA